MTNDGKVVVNELFETDGKKLNNFGETKDGVNHRRRLLLQGSAAIRQVTADEETTFDDKLSMSSGALQEKMDSYRERYREGEDMLKEVISK